MSSLAEAQVNAAPGGGKPKEFVDPVTGEKISKSEFKRRKKAAEKARKKAEKEAKKKAEAAKQPAKKKKNKLGGEDDGEVEPWKYLENRTRAIKGLMSKAEANPEGADRSECNPYPHKFKVSHRIPDFISQFGAEGVLVKEQTLEEEVSVSGRIIGKRASGSKLIFYTLAQEGCHLQVMSSLQTYGSGQGTEAEELAFQTIHARIKRGDIVGVVGKPGRTRTGELSIYPSAMRLLSPCLHMLPKGNNALTNPEVRFRQRYLDLILNPRVRDVFVTRAKIIQHVRKYLDARNFLEVETPMMNMIPGGATARPFETHHNQLNIKMYMRIAPELYLKELVVGGLDRVYEIGRQFRNEGMDQTHNPEFTTCEFYQAYADYHDLIEMTEEMLNIMVTDIQGGETKVEYIVIDQEKQSEIIDGVKNSAAFKALGRRPDQAKVKALLEEALKPHTVTIDFKRPFRKISMVSETERILKEKFADKETTNPGIFDLTKLDMNTEEARVHLKKVCDVIELEAEAPHTTARLLDELVGEFVEPTCINPTFICDHPEIMSPLAKYHREKKGLTERFELFVNGKELCNAYTELNNPFVQRERFEQQAQAKAAGDDEAMFIDQDFLKAMEFGLPPTGGWVTDLKELEAALGKSQFLSGTSVPNAKDEAAYKLVNSTPFDAKEYPKIASWLQLYQFTKTS
eukprot:g2250.t1